MIISECVISGTLVGFLPFGSSLSAKFFSISLQKSSTKQNSFVISSMGNLIYFFLFVEFTLLSCLFYSLFNPELALSEKPTVKQRRKKSYDIILRLINERAAKGKFYTKSQFCYLFEDTFGLKSCHSIRRYVNALVASGYIKFYEKEIPERVKVMKVAEHLTRRDI